jgi:outer membrane receptor protein involved in Fe transport
LLWRASLGRGFRAPSLAERYVQTLISGVTLIPNPDLQPETAWSAKLGTTNRQAGNAHFLVMEFVEGTDLASVVKHRGPMSVAEACRCIQQRRRGGWSGRTRGVDHPRTSPLTLSLAYTFSTRRLGTMPAQPLPFRPTHLLTLGADYGRGTVSIGADFRFMSRYEAVQLYAPTDPLVSPKVLDLRASLHRGRAEARLLLTNALNYIYNLAPRTLAPVRTLTLVASWTY